MVGSKEGTKCDPNKCTTPPQKLAQIRYIHFHKSDTRKDILFTIRAALFSIALFRLAERKKDSIRIVYLLIQG